MPQTKFNCKSCRRLIGKDMVSCPFCGASNPFYVQNVKKDDLVQKDIHQEPMNGSKEKGSSDKYSTEISVDSLEALYSASATDETTSSPVSRSVGTSQDAPCSSDETGIISSVQEPHRAHIAWKDETDKHEPTSGYKEMFNDKGVYQANYDGYYNDTLPKIQDEIDNIMIGREKTILKVVFSIIGIFAVIIYLVLTN